MSRNSCWNLKTPKGVVVDSLSCGSNGGCCDCDSRRGLCCTHIPCREPELWPVDRQSASSAMCRARASDRLSRGRNFVPVLSSPRCCLRGLAWRLSPRPNHPIFANWDAPFARWSSCPGGSTKERGRGSIDVGNLASRAREAVDPAAWEGRAVVIEAFERLLLPGASVEIVARSFNPPLVIDRSYASKEADRARSAELSRLAAFSAAGGSLRLMCWCAPRQCHAASIARAVASLAEEGLVGGKGSYPKFVFQHCSSSLGPLFVLFGPGAGSVRQRPSGKKASQPGCPPKQGKECVQERSSALLSSARIEIERSREQTLE
eukprot:scaffold3347_cov110-Isochrysis_galbana.AAC.6